MIHPDFWDFSVALYAQSGVRDACLELQDKHQLDVNLILFCIWHGCNQGELSEEILQQAVSWSDLWGQQVIKPLRHMRRWLKNPPTTVHLPAATVDSYREAVKQLELQGEKLQQNGLQDILKAAGNPRETVANSAALASLQLYIKSVGSWNDAVEVQLTIILDALQRLTEDEGREIRRPDLPNA